MRIHRACRRTDPPDTSITLINNTNNAYCLIIPLQIRFRRVLIKFISLQLKDIDFKRHVYVFVCKHILKWVLIQKKRQALAKIADKVAGSLFPSWRGPCLRVIFAPGRHCTQFRADWINQAPTMAHGLNERVKSFSAQHLFATVKLTAAEILYFEKTSWESMMIKKDFSHRAPGPF